MSAIAEVDPGLGYEAAYDSLWPDVLRLALAWTNDWAAAEDLAQEAFLRLWSARATIDWSRSPRPWLLLTTRRLATDRFRALRRRLGRPSTPMLSDESARDRWLDVSAALGRLTRTERTAIVLVALNGMPYDEAAGLLGTTAGALRAAVSRAREKLEQA